MRTLLAILALALLAACSSVKVDEQASAGAPPLCAPGRDLGAVVIVLETKWRANQKEPRVREAMAQRAAERAFAGPRCGRLAHIAPIADRGGQTDAALRTEFASSHPDTLVRVRVEELGPQLIISLPVLWTGTSEIKLHVTARDANATLLDLEHHRIVGGPFILRRAALAEGEFEAALRDILYRGAA